MPVEKTLFYLGKYAVKSFMKVAVRMDIAHGDPLPPGPKIFAVNHPTTTDPFVIASLFSGQNKVLVHETLFKIPAFGSYLKMAGHICVSPENGKKALDEAIATIHKGKSVTVFIEGGLSPRGGGFRSPRTGAVRMARATGAPVIPVGVAVLRKNIFCTKTKIEDRVVEAVWLKGGPYGVTTGKPLYFSGDTDVIQATAGLMNEVARLSGVSRERITGNDVPKYSLIQRLAGADALLRYTFMLHSVITFFAPHMKA